METPNMATVTASLQRSLQNCSLNHQQSSSSSSSGSTGAEQGSDSPPPPAQAVVAATSTVDLNSQSALPFHWEQYLDLTTGEIYYINWRTGMKVKEDPRYLTEEDSGSSCEEGEESWELSPCSPGDQFGNNFYWQEKTDDDGNGNGKKNDESGIEELRMSVLVVAGCKSCFMYFMVPKQAQACPKCCAHLLHFDRPSSSTS